MGELAGGRMGASGFGFLCIFFYFFYRKGEEEGAGLIFQELTCNFLIPSGVM